jgi:hypothetical protein
MNSRRLPFILALAALLILAALGWIVPLLRTTQAAPAPAADAAFKGKLLLVSTINMSTFLLEKAQLQRIGDQTWLMGKGAADGRATGWSKGRTVWVYKEHIVAITEFDDLKEAKKAMESGAGSPYGIIAPVPLEAPSAPPGALPVDKVKE